MRLKRLFLGLVAAVAALVLGTALLTGGPADKPEAKVKPVRALLITGGCCHDYTMQKQILTEATSARAHIEWVVVQQGGSSTKAKIPVYEKDDWAKGFDVVVHNECFADVKDPKWTERILKPHREGVPAVVIHCAMHCYRDGTGEWFKFCGVRSHQHGGHYPYEVVNVAPKDPILKGFPAKWKTPAGELYQIAQLGEHCKPLAHARSRETKKNEVCVWTNQYGKGRVFGTTIGHHNETMAEPVYLDMVTRGILWAAGKLEDRYLKPFDAEKQHFRWEKKVRPKRQTKEPPRALVPENLAKGKKATASSSQDEGRGPDKGNDGDLRTRWCASGPNRGEWWQIDLGKGEELTGCHVVWEFDGRNYRYKVEGSADGKKWSMLVDQTAGKLDEQVQEHAFKAKGVRYVRVTVTDMPGGTWPSFFEFAVHGTKLVKPDATTSALRADPRNLLGAVQAPPGFDVTLFAAPPDVSYPTCLAAAADGTVFVGVDLNGSLGARPKRGKVVRCVDTDGDGKADRFNVFAEVESPRGLWFDNNTLYVLHPPYLEALHDDDGDGVADRREVLLKGVGFDLKFRGADHTTNGIRMGIDGFLYIAVGDYGFRKAEGKDGRTLQLRGGGVVRIRPDGTGLELVADGLRNIYDVAVSPTLDLFTRDNTNDGGGWDVRLSHIATTGHFGYPRLFVHFGEEILQPLADYGGGAPCGSLFLDEPGWPKGFGQGLYTCDWGRSEVYLHPLAADGATWKAGQKVFVRIPRPTDIDVDGSGRMYLSSWKDGGFDFSKPDVGFVVRLTPRGHKAPPFPDLKKASDAQLLGYLGSPGGVRRLHAQREVLRRGVRGGVVKGLEELAAKEGAIQGRVAALFTLSQLLGKRSHEALLRLAKQDALREYALRALADDPAGRPAVPARPFVEALRDPAPRVRLQAVVALGRLGKADAAAALLPLTADKDPVVAHVAVNALVALRASAVCLAAVGEGKGHAAMALRVLQSLHEPAVVGGLVERYRLARDPAVRAKVLGALARLYHREAEWDGSWWGTRPDTTGPYFKPVTWSESEKIAGVLNEALAKADRAQLRALLPELYRCRVELPGMTGRLVNLAGEDAGLRRLAVRVLGGRNDVPAEAVGLLGEVAGSAKEDAALRAVALRGLLKRAGEAGARAAAVEALTLDNKPPAALRGLWAEFARDGRHAAGLGYFLTLAASSDEARRELAYGVLASVASRPAGPAEARALAARARAARAVEAAWERPGAAVALLSAVARLNLTGYAAQVRRLTGSASPEVAAAARAASAALRLDGARAAGPLVGRLGYARVLDRLGKRVPGDTAAGARAFTRLGCANCHTVAAGEALKGPFLGGIGQRYSRAELIESILKPSAKIAQGFETQLITLTNGRQLTGFVARESGTEVELRDQAGGVVTVKKSAIEQRSRGKNSVMPDGLLDREPVGELASLLAYLESLKGK
jgi:putative heme-binding domain-containing protein